MPTDAKALPTRIVGIDYGMARLGIAISDERKIIARPLMTLRAEKRLEATVAALVKTLRAAEQEQRFTIAELVIGLPLHMSGKHGVIADEVTHFSELLKGQSGWHLVLWDERLTSVQAERSMREGNLSRRRRAQLVDTVAAVLILQSYLDRQNVF
jgi:putative Holliday junction resolvase